MEYNLYSESIYYTRVALLFFSHSVMSAFLRPQGLLHARLHRPTQSCSMSCPLSRWCHPTISSSVIPFSSCLQSFPASGSFLMSQLLTSGGQSIGSFSFSISASHEYSRLIFFRISYFDLLTLQGPLRVFFSTTVQKHQFFGTYYELHVKLIEYCTFTITQ